jgi:hypothetical protein
MIIEKYELIVDFGNDPDAFNVQVNNNLKSGWELFGNQAIAIGINKKTGDEYYMFSQGMVKYQTP